MNAPIPISPSSAENFLQCPRKYALDFCDIPKDFSSSLHFGSAMHKTFKHLTDAHSATGEWLEVDEAGSVLTGYLRQFEAGSPKPLPAQLEPLLAEWFEDGIKKLSSFLRHIAPLITSAHVIDAERWVKLDLLDPLGTVRATGRLDLILELPNSGIWVIDFKTGRVKDSLEQSYPLALYTRTAQLEYPQAPAVRAFEVYFEPHRMLEYDTAQVAPDLKQLARVARNAFSEHEFPMHRGMLCAYCDYFRICNP